MPTGGDWDISSDLTVESATLFVGHDGGAYPGKVGIGTATPIARLHTQGAAAVAGTGTISSSGTTVTGTGTSFFTEFSIGDAIIASGQTRIVTAIATATSLTTDTAFSPVIAAGAAFTRQQPITRLADSGGATQLILNSQGNVGIGTTNPGYKLDVASGGEYTARFGSTSTDEIVVGGGFGKIHAALLDPPYTIAGEGLYATYAPSMTGVQEETSGVINLTQINEYDHYYSHIIDFSNLEKDSNLWLFYRITDFREDWQGLAVLLSGEGQGQVWYEKNPDQNQLVIYGENAGSVSFRLTSPRFDWKKHLNVRENGDIVGGLIEEVINDQYAVAGDDDKEQSFDAAQDKSLFDKFTSRVKEALASLGLLVEDGIASLTKVFAKEICLEGDDGETVCINKNQLKELLARTQAPAVTGTPVTEEPIEEAPAEEEPVVEEPVAEEPSVAEEEPPAEEPAVEEEPATEGEPVVEEEPAAEEPLIEEPLPAGEPESEAASAESSGEPQPQPEPEPVEVFEEN